MTGTPRSAPITLPLLGLGCARMGSFNNEQTFAESVNLVRHALDMGVSLFDTANIYGQGDSERAIGHGLKGSRDRAIVVTKAGNAFSARMRVMRPLKPLLRPLVAGRSAGGAVTAQRDATLRTDWSANGLLRSLEGSLRRLRMTHVDIFLLHSPPADIVVREETIAALDRALASGKARAVGVACDDLAALDAALAIPVTQVLELPWDILAGIAGTPRAAAIGARRIAVIAREVIRLQPGIPAPDAVANAVRLPFVASTLIGSRRIDRVRDIAQFIACVDAPTDLETAP